MVHAFTRRSLMESHLTAARRFFSKLILQHQNERFWHYGITLPASNSNSLASYLKLSQSEYELLLTSIGLMKSIRYGSQIKIQIQSKAWSDFIIQEQLDNDQIYFGKMCVNKVPLDGIDATESHMKYRGYWLGMGKYDLFEIPTTPLTQFISHNRPPRIPNRAKVTNDLRLVIKSMANLISQKLRFEEEHDDDDDGLDPSQLSSVSQSNATMASVQNLSSFLDDFKNNKRSKEETSAIIVESINESIREVNKKKREIFVDNIVRNVRNGDDENSLNIVISKDEIIPDIELRKSKVPALAYFEIPLHVEVLQLLLREITLLSNLFVDKNIMQFNNWKGKKTHLVQVPVCSNKETFRRMNQKKRFIDNIPNQIIGYNERGNIDEAEVAGWIIRRLGQLHEESFMKVCVDLGFSIGSRRMDMETSQAMWEEANVNTRSQRTILRYLHGTFGRRSINLITTGTKNDINNKVSNIGKYKSVEPISNLIHIEGECINYWTKPIIETLSSTIATRVLNDDNDETPPVLDMDNADLVLGGDHGQRKFRMLIKVILRRSSMEVIEEWPVKIAHIDCKKETYQILQQTIMPFINCDLRKLKDNNIELLLFEKCENDKIYYTCQLGKYDDNSSIPPKFICPETGIVRDDLIFRKCCKLRLIVTGDLAWYAAVLGKVNMSAHWCTWCNQNGTDWSNIDHSKGEDWTLSRMRELRERLRNKEVAQTASNRMGVVDVELLDAVDITQYIYPILHAEIGLGNYFLNSFFDWVDYRIENTTDDEREKKQLMKGILVEMENAEETVNDFDIIELTDLKLERSQLKETRGFRNDYDGSFIHSIEERKEIDDMVKGITVSIKRLEKEKKIVDDELRLKKKVYQTAKAELDHYKQKRGKKGDIRIELEKVLHKHGIRRPTYHGGDLTGVKIKVLLQSIDGIFGEFRVILLEGNDNKTATDNELNKMVDMYTHLGFLLDGMFSLGRTKCGQLTDEMIDLTRRMVVGISKMWRYLRLSMKGPKIHGMEDHLVIQMIQFCGIGDFSEDFIEQSHQFGVKEELRTRGLSRSKAFSSHSKWEWMGNQIGVRKAKEEIKRKTGRKRKRGIMDNIRDTKLSRDMKRNTSLEVVESGVYELIEDYRKADD